MIKSMTGFGKGTQRCSTGVITAEVKTLNNKNLSITCNPFNGFFLLEEKIKDVFAGKIHRGKVFVRINKETSRVQQRTPEIQVNEQVINAYLKKIKRIQGKLKVKGEITINEVISLPGVIKAETERQEGTLWVDIKKALEKATKRLVDYRKKEGMRLAKDFTKRLNIIKKQVQAIKRYGKKNVNEFRKKIRKNIKEISPDVEIDKVRLENEVASFAKNCDVTEEVTRMEGHLVAYKEAMNSVKTDIGKKLDFIAQEMQREVNTIGAKSSDYALAKAVIDIRSELEKIREQIKNIE